MQLTAQGYVHADARGGYVASVARPGEQVTRGPLPSVRAAIDWIHGIEPEAPISVCAERGDPVPAAEGGADG